jgi:hypothetical protein
MLNSLRDRKFIACMGERMGSELRNELVALCNCIAVALKKSCALQPVLGSLKLSTYRV